MDAMFLLYHVKTEAFRTKESLFPSRIAVLDVTYLGRRTRNVTKILNTYTLAGCARQSGRVFNVLNEDKLKLTRTVVRFGDVTTKL